MSLLETKYSQEDLSIDIFNISTNQAGSCV
jgi:hypothetical protein